MARNKRGRRTEGSAPFIYSIFHRYSFFWVTLVLFLGSFIGHWIFAWFAYVDEQEALGQAIEIGGYLVETARDTLENWQSEFLQLIWQVAGLAFLLHIGSPQSREGDERKEEKLDAILRAVRGSEAETLIATLNRKYPKK